MEKSEAKLKYKKFSNICVIHKWAFMDYSWRLSKMRFVLYTCMCSHIMENGKSNDEK